MALYQEQRNDGNVLTGYLRTNDSINIPLVPGNADYDNVLKWIALGNIADPDPDVLNKVKTAKIVEYKSEGVRRIGLQVSEWNTYDRIAFVASIWNMLGTPSAPQTLARDIYVYVKNIAIPNVNTQVDIASVQAIDVVNDPGFPI